MKYVVLMSLLLVIQLPLVLSSRLIQSDVEATEHQRNLLDEGNDQESVLRPKHLAMAVPGMFVLCCAFLCPCFRARGKETEHVLGKEPVSMPISMSPKLNRIGSVHLSMRQAAAATHNFSPSRQLGEGGFGTVYKGQLPNGQVVAIKRVKKGFGDMDGCGFLPIKFLKFLTFEVTQCNSVEHFESSKDEFKTEVELLAKIDHKNLVKLLGYVEEGNDRLIITEYVPNGTLRDHLDGLRGNPLDFNQRLEITIDVAHGLAYLHQYAEKKIIHRDVKSTNILLTESTQAKVADFGFARHGDVESDKTHVSTKVKGTHGYTDPEYMNTFQLTPKSDVYSFGVLILEILTGRRPLEPKRADEERSTVRWADKEYKNGNMEKILDPSMGTTVDRDTLKKMFDLAFSCVTPKRAGRPDMKSVGEQLFEIRRDYRLKGATEE